MSPLLHYITFTYLTLSSGVRGRGQPAKKIICFFHGVYKKNQVINKLLGVAVVFYEHNLSVVSALSVIIKWKLVLFHSCDDLDFSERY